MNTFHTRIRHFILQHSTSLCDLCGLTIGNPNNETIWCPHCLALFTPEPRCQRCGLKTMSNEPQCGHCLSEPPLWNRLYCVGEYSPPLSSYIQRLKYSGQYQHAYDLSYLLAKRIPSPAPLITCVPLHWRRALFRGYNQSERLGHYLNSHFSHKVVFDPAIFKRTLATPSQQGLHKSQREKNLRGAFTLNRKPNQTHIAIVDDVVTTGSTVRQLCNLLLEVGIEKIDIYCICRTGL